MGSGMTSKHALRKARAWLREAREAYHKARSVALHLGKGAGIIAREDALGAALMARHDYRQAQRNLARLEACELVPYGGYRSDNALKRHGHRG